MQKNCSAYCHLRLTRDMTLKFTPVPVTQEEIPSGGLCQKESRDGRLAQCKFPYLSESECQRQSLRVEAK